MGQNQLKVWAKLGSRLVKPIPCDPYNPGWVYICQTTESDPRCGLAAQTLWIHHIGYYGEEMPIARYISESLNSQISFEFVAMCVSLLKLSFESLLAFLKMWSGKRPKILFFLEIY